MTKETNFLARENFADGCCKTAVQFPDDNKFVIGKFANHFLLAIASLFQNYSFCDFGIDVFFSILNLDGTFCDIA